MGVTPIAMPADRLKDASDLLKVLSHPARLRLVLHLTGGEAPVSGMERELGIRQPGLSQHLGELREAGLVATRREHKVVFYTLTDDRTRDLLSALSAVFSRALRRHRAAPGAKRLGGAAMFATAGDAA